MTDRRPEADDRRATLIGAVEAIGPLVASGVCAGLGAQIALPLVGGDAKRALIGAPIGALTLTALLLLSMLVFGRRYRAFGGSPTLVVLASLIIPAVLFLMPLGA
jgi:hypothetical protein